MHAQCCLLSGLADENESVLALGVGHVLVEHYATTSLPHLLLAVEDGIFNDSWRIRQSSVELLGDLLFKVVGTSGKALLEGGSHEGSSTEAHGRAIIEGACVGLSEVMASAGKSQLLSFMNEFIPTIRTAFCDSFKEKSSIQSISPPLCIPFTFLLRHVCVPVSGKEGNGPSGKSQYSGEPCNIKCWSKGCW
ncbi:hypothetical protein Fmac_029105 [Flemingia macrophylla]|uniref:ARM repeat superfamily protein n=1 Tax=Flemingia macrophylla TaxID=520843 RepID=A0ABD1L9J1_9FABA